MSSGSESDDGVDWDAVAGQPDLEGDDEDMLAAMATLDLYEEGVVHAGPEACLTAAKERHGLDLKLLRGRMNLDFFSYLRLINYVRKEKPAAASVMAMATPDAWADDKYLKPTVEDDPLLMLDMDEDDFTEKEEEKSSESDVASLRLALQAKDAALEEAQENLNKMQMALRRMMEEPALGEAGKSSTGVASQRTEDEDQSYASSYGHFGIHHEMLSDRSRTESYKKAIEIEPLIGGGGRVLDVGCGTSILSMFAARGGAAEVVGVDMSSIIDQAHDIVRENGLDKVIHLRRGRLEDLMATGSLKGQFDVIVSEWMGYFLLYEGMLDTVINARDKLLKPGGRVMPDSCGMYLVAIEDTERHKRYVDYWNDVYGFKMTCMKKPVLKEASVEALDAARVVSTPASVLSLDLNVCSVADTEFESSFTLEATRDGEVTALAGFFDVTFSGGGDHQTPVVLSTAPDAPLTHWKQTLFYLDEALPVKSGQKLEGHLSVTRPKHDARSLNIKLILQGKTRVYSMD